MSCNSHEVWIFLGTPAPSPDNVLGPIYGEMFEDFLTSRSEANEFRAKNNLPLLG